MAQRMMWIVWPAFLAACALELLVFAFVDPQDLHWAGRGLEWSRQAVYTCAFFAFWAVVAATCWITTLLRLTPLEINQCPFDPGRRPAGCPGEAQPR